jgi:TRAP-type C4-dicarboxylate transport system substrate-binding protein
MAMVTALGGAPTPISWGELYTALQQGVVDGAENNPPSFHLSRHFEVARFYSLDEHTAVPDVLLVGTASWQRLDDQERAWLTAAAQDSARFEREIWHLAEEEAIAAVKAAGVAVLTPDKAAFAAKAAPLLASLEADPELGPLLAAALAVPGAPEVPQP